MHILNHSFTVYRFSGVPTNSFVGWVVWARVAMTSVRMFLPFLCVLPVQSVRLPELRILEIFDVHLSWKILLQLWLRGLIKELRVQTCRYVCILVFTNKEIRTGALLHRTRAPHLRTANGASNGRCPVLLCTCLLCQAFYCKRSLVCRILRRLCFFALHYQKCRKHHRGTTYICNLRASGHPLSATTSALLEATPVYATTGLRLRILLLH